MDYGSGYTATPITGQVSPAGIAFNGLSLTAPANGSFNLKVSGIRAAVFQGNGGSTQSVVASLSFGLPLDQSQVVVAYAQRGLFATLYQAGITCVGSPLPSTVSVSSLFGAGTAFASTRLTEG